MVVRVEEGSKKDGGNAGAGIGQVVAAKIPAFYMGSFIISGVELLLTPGAHGVVYFCASGRLEGLDGGVGTDVCRIIRRTELGRTRIVEFVGDFFVC